MSMETAAQSFSLRRPAAGSLPHFQLPPPPNIPLDIHQVPRVTGTESLSPVSTGINSGSSQSSQTSITSYNPQGSWPLPGTSSYTYSSMSTSGQPGLMQHNYNRNVFSPTGAAYQTRTSQSPTTGDGLQPQYDAISSSYSLPIPQANSGHTHTFSQASHHQPLPGHLLSSQAPTSHPPTPSSAAPSDHYSRGPPTPSYIHASSTTPQQSSFPSFAPHHSPTQHSPTTTGSVPRGIPALSSHPSPMQAPPSYSNRQYGYQALPSVMGGGAVLSNMANPGGQMTLVGGGLHSMPPYTHHLGPHPGMLHHSLQVPQQDRPFKCDECPQSFNRNHDLKRHKKIHLAVKPFPCGHCDKSFSRKDALKALTGEKRHRLVKGCGNAQNTQNGNKEHEEVKPDVDDSQIKSERA